MGWYGNYNSVEEIKTEITCNTETTTYKQSTIVYDYEKQCNVIWGIVHIVKENIDVIFCAIIQKQNKMYMYKPMDESVHPFYYSCPIKFLAETTVQSKQWRQNVYAYHNKYNK